MARAVKEQTGHNPETSWRILYEVRNGQTVQTKGEAFGSKAWIDHPQFSTQNTIKRVKSALGLKWSVKTFEQKGDGDICKRFDDGRTLHIWVMRDDTGNVAQTVQAPSGNGGASGLTVDHIEMLKSFARDLVDDSGTTMDDLINAARHALDWKRNDIAAKIEEYADEYRFSGV